MRRPMKSRTVMRMVITGTTTDCQRLRAYVQSAFGGGANPPGLTENGWVGFCGSKVILTQSVNGLPNVSTRITLAMGRLSSGLR